MLSRSYAFGSPRKIWGFRVPCEDFDGTVASRAPGKALEGRSDRNVIRCCLRDIVLRLRIVGEVALDGSLKVGVHPPEDVALAHAAPEPPHAVAAFIVGHRVSAVDRV